MPNTEKENIKEVSLLRFFSIKLFSSLSLRPLICITLFCFLTQGMLGYKYPNKSKVL